MRYALVPVLVVGLALAGACGGQAEEPGTTPSKKPVEEAAPPPAVETILVELSIEGMT